MIHNKSTAYVQGLHWQRRFWGKRASNSNISISCWWEYAQVYWYRKQWPKEANLISSNPMKIDLYSDFFCIATPPQWILYSTICKSTTFKRHVPIINTVPFILLLHRRILSAIPWELILFFFFNASNGLEKMWKRKDAEDDRLHSVPTTHLCRAGKARVNACARSPRECGNSTQVESRG